MSNTTSIEKPFGIGYLPDLADFRDYSKENVKEIYNALKLEPDDSAITPKNDFSSMFTAIRSQGSLGSCTAYASATGLVEFINKNAYNDITQISTLFQYKLTRNLMGVKGDTGAYMRTAMQALVEHGTVPEKAYPYTTDLNKFDLEPNIDLKIRALNAQAIKYVRLDPRNVSTVDVLKELRRHSAKNIPVMFGFSVYDNAWKQANSSGSEGAFPFPSTVDKMVGGHAVVIAGHDDNKKIVNKQDGKSTLGAFKIRNSWGVNWGVKGYGWIPYKYIEQQLAMDFWTLLAMEYIDRKVFN